MTTPIFALAALAALTEGRSKRCRKLSAVIIARHDLHPPIMPSFLFSMTLHLPRNSDDRGLCSSSGAGATGGALDFFRPPPVGSA